MRFSIIGAPRQRWDLGETAAQAWWDFVEDAVLAEKLGFDAVYTGEHHFCFASGSSSPLALLTDIAARTERIRVGTSVICAPFHNPLRLAEDIASAAPGRSSILSNAACTGVRLTERSTGKASTTTFRAYAGSCRPSRSGSRSCGEASDRRASPARFSVGDVRHAWQQGTFRGGPFLVPIAGTVEDVTEHVLKIVRGEMGLITHVGLQFREPGTNTEHVHRTMTLFAQEVLPVLRAEAAKLEAERQASSGAQAASAGVP